MTEVYRGRTITASAVEAVNGGWAVMVKIDGKSYYADDGITYILEEEAEKESLNLGRNLIKRGKV